MWCSVLALEPSCLGSSSSVIPPEVSVHLSRPQSPHLQNGNSIIYSYVPEGIQ